MFCLADVAGQFPEGNSQLSDRGDLRDAMSLRGRFRGSGVSDLESGGEREGKGGRGAAGEGD